MITEQQRIDRLKGIGGSDTPIILGLSGYMTPYQLYLHKLGVLNTPQVETPNQYWGKMLEPVIVKEFEVRNNVNVWVPTENDEAFVHPILTFMRGNVDGFIKEHNAILEVKCSKDWKEWGAPNSDHIPLAYLAQVAHYCIVTNADFAHIAVLIAGFDYREYRYNRDAAIEKVVINNAKNFWDAIQNKTPPLPVNEKDLALLYARGEKNKTIVVDESVKSHIDTLIGLKAKFKQLKIAEVEARFNVMQYMQDAEKLVDEDDKIIATWNTTKRSRSFSVKEPKINKNNGENHE